MPPEADIDSPVEVRTRGAPYSWSPVNLNLLEKPQQDCIGTRRSTLAGGRD